MKTNCLMLWYMCPWWILLLSVRKLIFGGTANKWTTWLSTNRKWTNWIFYEKYCIPIGVSAHYVSTFSSLCCLYCCVKPIAFMRFNNLRLLLCSSIIVVYQIPSRIFVWKPQHRNIFSIVLAFRGQSVNCLHFN
jgi:hypothetical protein